MNVPLDEKGSLRCHLVCRGKKFKVLLLDGTDVLSELRDRGHWVRAKK